MFCRAEQPTVIRVNCPAPVLTIGFPNVCPGPGTVTLANGAVVDLIQLGQVLSQFCPGLSGRTEAVVVDP